MARAAVIGAGLAGLTAARMLAEAGVAATVFEKSRGLGGRLATRRTPDGLDFDHGAAALAPGTGGFAAALEAAVAAGDAAWWHGEAVGLPGMSGIARGLAAGLDLRFGVEATAAAREGAGWRVRTAVGDAAFEAVIVAVPAPQAARLCAGVGALAVAAGAARMAPCWTLMAAWDEAAAAPDRLGEAAFGDGPLASATRVSAKPGRAAAPERWVAHAAQGWTEAHLERAAEEAAPALAAALGAALGLDPSAALHARAHRWRYARVTRPVGETHLAADGLFAAGDWLLGPEAADAWASGRAAGAAALARLG
jgi:predicted NAD/FAD-dependent oxidoreductase